LASNYDAGVQVTGCWFEEVTSPGSGGAIAVGSTVPSVITDCVFWKSTISTPGNSGGALAIGGGVVLTGCTFVGNSGTHAQLGGAARITGGTATLTNNVFHSTLKGRALELNGTVVTGGCNVFWDNPDGLGYAPTPTDQIADPQFCNPDSGIFAVTTASPCLPVNNPGCTQIGAFGAGCDPISIDATSWGQIKASYRREPDEGARP
jgi:hypothetical protein